LRLANKPENNNNPSAILLHGKDLPVYQEVAQNINSAMDLMKKSIQDILVRFELVTKAINVGLWDMMTVIVDDPINPNNELIFVKC
jgi:hypothetical protein